MVVAEAAEDRGAREVHERVDAVEQVGSRRIRIPVPLPGPGLVPDEPHHAVPAGAEERRERGADEPGCTGDGHGDRRGAELAVSGEVVGELLVAVDEHGPQQPRADLRLDPVVHDRRVAERLEPVLVAPVQRGEGDGGEPVAHALVDECAARDVAGRIVLRDPDLAPGQGELGAAVGERRRLPARSARQPRRREALQRARPLMPREDLVDGSLDDAAVLDAHGANVRPGPERARSGPGRPC
ncbi:hypothetical protein GCM10009640_21080 [Agrococcus citreus]|uniref:Uncharacterized protein n=1 Tax=Agrococcus citreus TaxID=84643 RepID=A0ABN1Z0T5_9MICO